MNRTQKVAWFNLAMVLLGIAIGVWVIVEVVFLRRLPEGFAVAWPLIVFWLLVVIAVISLGRKQSPAEVDADERDNVIKSKAVLASFVSVWVLLAVSSVIPRFVVGGEGSIPVFLLAFINVGILLVAMLVYCVAVLVQYGRRGKGEK